MTEGVGGNEGKVVADFGQSNFGQSIFGQPIWPANFGQSIFDQCVVVCCCVLLWCCVLLLCVVVVCCCCWCCCFVLCVVCCVSPKPLGFHTTVREPEWAHLRAPALQTPPKFHEKTPRGRLKDPKWERKRVKKARNLGPSTFRGPTIRGPISSGFGPTL